MQNIKDGFFLKKFEIFNWGTFDNQVETFWLDDKVTVVSGDNGSGKSTVVDALVSLLVPNRMRKYNLSASDGNTKKSRNESTYVRGAYKNKETDQGVQVDFLRGNDAGSFTYSILLGYFYDASTEKEITLASFFRTTTTDSLDKFSIISQGELCIQEDFLNILQDTNNSSPVAKLKTVLKTRNATKLYDKFEEYIHDYSDFFGIRPNAIELFNKVVSLKEIKDLNSFFKENMLEKNEDIVKEFEECEKNYLGVKDIYDSIILAEKKLEILIPFMEQKKEYGSQKNEWDQVCFLEEHFENYSAGIEYSLIEKTTKVQQEQFENSTLKKEYIKNTLTHLNEEKRQIRNLIDSSDFAKRLREIENTIAFHSRDLSLREKSNADYIDGITALGGIFDGTLSNFEGNLKFISEKIQNTHIRKEQTNEQILQESLFLNTSEGGIMKLTEEINYLQARKDLLPQGLADIRRMICRNLPVAEDEFPFICELIRVKDSEKPWMMAIEKLLHSFGQEMLVPDEWIDRVNRFVDANHLKGKLKYNRVSTDGSTKILEISEQSVITKIDIKHGSSFENWIRQNFVDRFDYHCLENIQDPSGNNFSKILTISGLIKNKQSYLKDDRPFSTRNYILGWDNAAKMLELEKERNSEEKKREKIKERILNLKKIITESEYIERITTKLESIKVFSDIDSISIKILITDAQKEKEKIEKSDTTIKGYQIKLAELDKQIHTEELSLEEITKSIGVIEESIRKLRIRKEKLSQLLEKVDQEVIQAKFKDSPYSIASQEISNFETERENRIQQIRRKKDKITEVLKTIENKMNGFATSYRENRMTITEKNEIYSGIAQEDFREYLDREYHKIQDEELYKYKEKFEKEFRDNLFSRLNDFYHSLENEQAALLEKIAEINNTLKGIRYSKTTYIEIATKDNVKKTDGIEDFKKEFREKVIYKRELDMTDKIKAFESIKNLMEKLIAKEAEVWVANVIDVRNWFLFSVKERFAENDEIKDIYESSSGKSGGQTIKLAYGVLAAALLYQYGIKERNTNLFSSESSKSFRLVVIDEVFAKLDIDNSRYVLDLFDTLGLQLFIITPTNTINVLEDYVKTIYFISNNTGAKSFKNKLDIVSRQKIEDSSF